jgi:hypothetical protein
MAMKWVLQRTCLSAINILFGVCRPCTWLVLFYTTLYKIVYSARHLLTVNSVSTVSPCQFVLSFSKAQSARVNTHKKKDLREQIDSQTGMYSKHIRTLDTRHSQHNNTTAFNINLQRSLLFENQTNQKNKQNACNHSILSLERAMAKLVHARDYNEKTHAQLTIDQYFWSGYQLAQAAPVTRKWKWKWKTNKHIIKVERAQDSIICCPRDQLAETSSVRRRQSQPTRNAFSFLLERPTRRSSQRNHLWWQTLSSYLHRHTPRRSRDHSRMAQSAWNTTCRWRALLEWPLAERLGHGEGCCLMLCAAKDETSVDTMRRMFCCNFLRKSRLWQIWLARRWTPDVATVYEW